MEILVNISLRGAPLRGAVPVSDIVVRDVYAKEPDEVVKEISEKLEDIIEQAYEEMP